MKTKEIKRRPLAYFLFVRVEDDRWEARGSHSGYDTLKELRRDLKAYKKHNYLILEGHNSYKRL